MSDRVLRTGIASTLWPACGCKVHTDERGKVSVERKFPCQLAHGEAPQVTIPNIDWEQRALQLLRERNVAEARALEAETRQMELLTERDQARESVQVERDERQRVESMLATSERDRAALDLVVMRQRAALTVIAKSKCARATCACCGADADIARSALAARPASGGG